MKGLRLPEWVKNVLIAVLSLTAIYLFTLSPLYLNSPLRGWTGRVFSSAEPGTAVSVSLTAAARPSRVVVTNGAGRCGAQYDSAAVDALFDQTGALLGEALGSAGTPSSISERRWRQALEGDGVYYDFTGCVPISALAGWMREGESNPLLTGDVRRLALAPGDGGAVWLFFQDAWDPSAFYSCVTALRADTHLRPLTAAFVPNGAKFAFEDSALDRCYPYTLVTQGVGEAAVYTASSPLAAGGEALEQPLSSLSFSGPLVTSYTGDDGTVYRAGDDALLLGRDGSLLYRGADGARYPVACAGAEPTVGEMIETTRQLVTAVAEPLCGEARLYLISALREGEETVITYGYSLNGAAVWLGSDGWAAQFSLTGGALTGFLIRPRCYTASGASLPLLPAVQAAAAMEAKGAEGSELLLVYRDTGGETAAAGWTAA